MPTYLTESEVKSKSSVHARAALKSICESQSSTRTYDIFLSHCFRDVDLIEGLTNFLKGLGFSVYVDWLEDPTLDREKVTPATAAVVKTRMKNSKTLIFATSENSSTSKWMPWELGFFDGYKPGKIGILPITASATSTFSGQEYLGLYPTISFANAYSRTLQLNKSTTDAVSLNEWISR